MDRAGGSAFALHLGDLRDGAPDVEAAFRGPLIGPLSHVGGRRNGIDSDDFVDAISDAGNGLVAVHGLEFALHESPLYTGQRYAGQRLLNWQHGLKSNPRFVEIIARALYRNCFQKPFFRNPKERRSKPAVALHYDR